MHIEIQTKFICQFFNQTTLEVCEGQALDKEFENDIKIGENEYLTMVEKTQVHYSALVLHYPLFL